MSALNNLRQMKKYQSNSGEEPGGSRDNDDLNKRQKHQLDFDNDEFMDLSNIQDISDLNQLSAIEKNASGLGHHDEESNDDSQIGIDDVEVDLDEHDLDESEIEQMERIIRKNMALAKDRGDTHHLNQELYSAETPASGMSEEGNFFENGGKPAQIQNELQQLLAQSSSEQLLMINDENNDLHLTESEEQELRRKWLQENGLFSAEDSPALAQSAEKDGEHGGLNLGDEPLALDGNQRELMAEVFEDQRRANSNSPPLVADLRAGQGANELSRKPGSTKLATDERLKDVSRAGAPPIQELKASEKPSLGADLGAELSGLKATEAKEKPQAAKAGKEGEKAIDASGAEGDENDSFHRLYNKEIKVNQDEIPLLLLELTDIAYKFIKKDQFEKAYVLLQKTESVLEVVNLEHSKRDRYFAYITYLNMAMCFQKLGMLEECIIYLKETIQVIEKPNFFKDVSIAQRMKQMHMQCQLKLQLCAILSQTQKHTEAMENAKASVRLAHQILRDKYDLCVFYSNKIKFKDDFASLSLLLMDENDEDQLNSLSLAAQTKSKQCYGTDLGGPVQDKDKIGGSNLKHTKSEINEKMYQKQFIRENSPVRDIPYNILEESISMIERTALKLLPIMKELGNRLAGTNKAKGVQAFHTNPAENSIETKHLSEQKAILQDHLRSKKANNERGLLEDESEDIKDVDLEIKDKLDADPKAPGEKKAEDQVDMRTILGFLNQNEWILNLNIGNIMQIQPVRMRDFLQFHRNEHQLSRESFLEKLQLLVVSYFCVSTELRFIVQSRSGFMKPETKKEKELEQEYWHVKALDIACAFLPSECPLFNHILLSYQKHHDPTMQPIDEDKEQEDVLSVLRPLKGIENSKYQPIIREVENVYIDIAEIPLSPLSKCFDQRLMPKKVKTASMNVQTDPIEESVPPLMKSQSVSIQNEFKEEVPEVVSEVKQEVEARPSKVYQDSETLTEHNDIFDVNNAYLDLSSSKYQENLMEKIINDPKINDKQQFLSQLITRVQSQDPERFRASVSHQSAQAIAPSNTQSQNFKNISYFQQQYTGDTMTKQTLTAGSSIGIEDQGIYGHQGGHRVKSGHMANKNKNTQSGQLNYKAKREGQNFEDLQYSFDMKSQYGKNHVRSMHGVGDAESEATAIGTGMKHHIASQSLAPSQTVFTDHKSSKKGAMMSKNSHLISHKKNQSISGLMKSEDMFKNTNLKAKQTMEYSSVNRQFNNSVNSNFSSKPLGAKKKQGPNKSNDKKEQARLAQGNKMLGQRIDKASQNINLSNQKQQKQHKTQKNHQSGSTIKKNLDKSGRHGKALNQSKQSKSYQSTHIVHKIPAIKNEDSLMKEIGDVMSSSYSESENGHCSSPSSGADPDLQAQLPSQPESSMSEMNKTHTDQSIQSIQNTHPDENLSAIFRSQEERDRYLAAKNKYSTHQDPNRQKPEAQGHLRTAASNENAHSKKQRPSSSSAITNYTSGQSALRSKLAKQRVNNLQQQQLTQNFSKGHMNKQLAKIQQQQNLLSHMKQSKQKQLDNGAPIVPKKKSKVLSRKKYGSDKSSNSPPQNVTQSGGGNHGYSIAQGPFSIFDSGNSHSISKFSNLQQSKQSIPDQPVAMYQYQDKSLGKKKKSTHMNSQTIQIENKNQQMQKAQKAKKEPNVQNQSENILSRLQNLLVKKEDDKLNRYDVVNQANVRKVEKKPKALASGQNASSQVQMRAQYASHGQYNNSNPRKSANSIGSLGYSHSNQTRQSRYSANSKQSHSRKSRENNSKKSRPSRSKSSGKSGRGQKSVSNERSKDRSQNNQMNISNQEGFNTSHVSPQVNQSQILQPHSYLDSDGDHVERNQRSFELQPMGQEAGRPAHQSQDTRKRKARHNALRQRPKTSMMFEGQRESLNGRKPKSKLAQPKKSLKQQNNHSIENLQRQVLENQKILLSNAGLQQRSQKQSKRNAHSNARHNHNNSISHMNGAGMNNQSLFGNQNQAFQTNMSSSGPVSGVSANTFSKKKSTRKTPSVNKTAGPQQRVQGQQMVGSYQQSQVMANLQSGLQNIQNKNLSLKLTQQHLSANLKNFANIVGAGGGVSTTASTTGAAQQFQSNKSMRPRKQNAHKRKGSTSGQGQLAQREFVNFEQMQQQLEGGVTLGGGDIQQPSGPEFTPFLQEQQQPMDMDQIQEGQHVGFVPHKNLMPKTTGSQAHLLNISQQQDAASSVGPALSGVGATQKSFHSLNQTGRTAGSANKTAAQSQPQGGRRTQKSNQ